MNNKLGNALKTILFLGVGLTILWFLYQSLNGSYQEDCALRGIAPDDCNLWQKLISDLRSTNLFWLIIIVICFFISNVSRALRWQQLIQSLGYKTRSVNSFLTTMLGYFANLGLPRLGEFIRAGSFARYEHLAFEQVMGTVAVDRIVDLICFAIMVGLGLLFQYDILWTYLQENSSLPILSVFQSWWFYLILVIGLLSFLVIYRFWTSLQHIPFIAKMDSLFKGFIDGLKSISKIENISIFVAHSITIWLMYYLMTFLCFKAFEPTAALGPLAGLLVFVFGSIGMIIPSPGGMGSYHALVIAALVIYGVRADDAFSFAMIIFFTINIFGNVLFGILALLFLPGYNQHYKPARS